MRTSSNDIDTLLRKALSVSETPNEKLVEQVKCKTGEAIRIKQMKNGSTLFSRKPRV